MIEFNLSAHAQRVINERNIKIEWIFETINAPDKTEPDSKDKALEHNIKMIKEFDNRVLRVISNKSIVPVLIITALFDRSMKGKF